MLFRSERGESIAVLGAHDQLLRVAEVRRREGHDAFAVSSELEAIDEKVAAIGIEGIDQRMRNVVLTSLFCALMSTAAIAQTSTTAPTPSPNAPADANAPLPGANSFTEGQAKSRLEANGYSNVSSLKKDDNGVWKGTATHSGAQVTVSVDYRGNITRN